MGIPYEPIVAEDLNRGYGPVQVTMPAGGSATGSKIGIHTFINEFNVKDFGAVGDGQADDTAAIQLAITTALAAIAGGNRSTRVLMPQGVYLVGTITIQAVVGGVHLVGAGIENTVLRLKGGTNGPAIDVGGAVVAQGTNLGRLSDFSIDGNSTQQSVPAPALRCRLWDRGQIERVYVYGSLGDGMEVDDSSIAILRCEVAGNGANGITFDAVTSCSLRDCFLVDNAGYGLVCQFTHAHVTDQAVALADAVQADISACHFEQNVSGEVLITGVNNVYLHHNELQPKAGATAVVMVTGVARKNAIDHNFFVISGVSHASTQTQSPEDFYTIYFDTQTAENNYGPNQGQHHSFDTAFFEMDDQVLDLGRNYCYERDQFHPRQWGGDGGGHALGGWDVLGRTNYCLWSEDLTNGVWTRSNIDAITQTSGNPLTSVSAGSFSAHSTVDVHPTPNSTLGTVTQSITGLSIAAGDLWTFSAWLKLNSWALGQATDIRMRILDATNNVLADVAVLPKATWRRYSVSFVAGGSASSVQVQFYKYAKGATTEFFVWGAMFSKGDLSPYIPTTSVAVTGPQGFSIPRALISKVLQIGIGGAPLVNTIYYEATWNPGAIANGDFGHNVQTVPGVVPGDFLILGYTATQQIAGLIVSAICTANDTVIFQCFNFSGGPVTPTGTGRLLVFQSIRPANV